VPEDYDKILRARALKGLETLNLHINPEYLKRLEYELSIVEKLGFAPYFLVVEDYVAWARSQGLLVGPGRGSACGSLLTYALSITRIDPIKYSLYFERFLNPDRVAPPDIDTDFSERDPVIRYIKEKYGEDKVARIGTYNFLRTKSAIRDICRVLEKPYSYAEELSNLVPPARHGLWTSFDEEAEVEPLLLDPKYEEVISLVRQLWGVIRSSGGHASGVAISPDTISSLVPLYSDSPNKESDEVCRMVTQVDYRDFEEIGLLKFDILGLSTLRVIALCLSYIKKRTGEVLDIETIPEDDQETFSLICSGDLDGVFQLGGSESIKQLTVSLSPTSIKDLSFISALFRPGPLSSGMVDKVGKIKNGDESPSYLSPELIPILEETFGIPVYQEQVMRICRDLAGYTMTEADNVRKMLGKKQQEKLLEERGKFTKGCVNNGIKEETANKIFDIFEEYATYLFNQSHSVAYAYISYQTAYLKAHYPQDFYTALLAIEGKPDNILQFVRSAKDQGISFLPPDVNKSSLFHSPDDKDIRFGLLNIKGVLQEDIESLLKEREISPFTSYDDLAERSGIYAKTGKLLGLAGALSTLPTTEGSDDGETYYSEEEAGEHLEKLVAYYSRKRLYNKNKEAAEFNHLKRVKEAEDLFQMKLQKYEKEYYRYLERIEGYDALLLATKEKNLVRIANGKTPLKDPVPPKRIPRKPEYIAPELDLPAPPRRPAPPIPTRKSARERALLQRSVLGMYLDHHPIDQAIIPNNATEIGQLSSAPEGSYCVISGVLLSVKEVNTRKKTLMARIRLEDKSRSIESVLFPHTYGKLETKLKEGTVYTVNGKVEKTSFIGDDGEERQHLQVICSSIKETPTKQEREWVFNYPLLKGKLQVYPDIKTTKSRAKEILTGYHRRRIDEARFGYEKATPGNLDL